MAQVHDRTIAAVGRYTKQVSGQITRVFAGMGRYSILDPLDMRGMHRARLLGGADGGAQEASLAWSMCVVVATIDRRSDASFRRLMMRFHSRRS
jgi:hypothetical protein